MQNVTYCIQRELLTKKYLPYCTCKKTFNSKPLIYDTSLMAFYFCTALQLPILEFLKVLFNKRAGVFY